MSENEIDTDIINKAQLYNSGDRDGVEKIEAYFKAIAKKLYKDWNPDSTPIHFRLSEDIRVNASIFANAKPPVIVITRGTLKFVRSEDELAFVIGHELGHKDFKGYFKFPWSTKGEETAADILATQALINGKYTPYAGISFFRRLQEKIDAGGKPRILGDGKLLEIAFDPHPDHGSRVFAIETFLGKKTIVETGKIDIPTELPLDTVVNGDLGSARYKPVSSSDFPDDYMSRTPDQKLSCIQELLEKNLSGDDASSKKGKKDRAQLIHAIEDIKSNGSQKYKDAADNIIFMAERTDPYNLKGAFDPIYKAVAETFSDYRAWECAALGSFKKVNQDLERLFAENDYSQGESINVLGNSINDGLKDVLPYLVKGLSVGNSARSDSEIIRKTSLKKVLEAEDLSSLYHRKWSKEAAETIWRLGGGYDEGFWRIIGPEQVRQFRDVPPLSQGKHDNDTSEHFKKSVYRMQAEIDKWLNKQKPDASETTGGIISSYVKQHEFDLFPLSNIKGFDSNNLPTGDARKFSSFVEELFRTAKEDERENLVKQLDSFYNECSSWCDQLRPNKSYKKNLSDSHPYVELLLSRHLKLKIAKKKELMSRILDIEDISSAWVVRGLYEIQTPDSIEGCLNNFKTLKNEKDSALKALSDICASDIKRILAKKDGINLDDPDLIKLSKIAPDNPEYQNGSRYNPYPQKIINQSIRDVLSEKIQMGSKEDISSALKSTSLEEVASLYRFLERNTLFPSTTERSAVGDVLLKKLKQADSETKMKFCEKMLLRTPLPSFNPEKKGQISDLYIADNFVTGNLSLRNEIIKVWQKELIERHGLDNGGFFYRARVGQEINKIFGLSVQRDQSILLEALANGLVIQSPLAKDIRDLSKPNEVTLVKAHLAITGGEALSQKLVEKEGLRIHLINYLSEPLSKQSRTSMAIATKSEMGEEEILKLMSPEDDTRERGYMTPKDDQKLEYFLEDVHNHFRYLSIEQRTGVLSALLVPGEHRLYEDKYKKSYNKALTLVMNKVFPEKTDNSNEAKAFIQAYLKTAADHERTALLAGMLSVSIDSDPSQPTSTATQAAKIMATLGPAYVKLGQAINSHPLCPPDWKKATDGLKSEAETAPRWELIRQIEERSPYSQKINPPYYGPVLGSASFNTAMSITIRRFGRAMDLVALLERPNAAERAEAGFEHLIDAVETCEAPTIKKYIGTIREMLGEAKEMAKTETSWDIGDQQYAAAKKAYKNKQIEILNGKTQTTININPVRSIWGGNGLRIISLAEGTHFSDLPETTPTELNLKKTIAKAYVALEMSSLLSGRPFDCDRHGKQLKVVVHPGNTVDLNLYDFGGFAITPPTDKQKAALGKMLSSIAEGITQGDNPESIMMDTVDKTTNVEERQYLMRVRKSWLALNDFTRYLDGKDDYQDVIHSAVSAGVDSVIVDNMSMLSKRDATALKLATFLKMPISGPVVIRTRSGISSLVKQVFKEVTHKIYTVGNETKESSETKNYRPDRSSSVRGCDIAP